MGDAVSSKRRYLVCARPKQRLTSAVSEMTSTATSRENSRQLKGKRRSVSDATSPIDDLSTNGNPLDGSGIGRGTKRVRDDFEDTLDEKKGRSLKKGARSVEDSDMAVDEEEAEVDADEGDTRCVCGKRENDEGGLMIMCENCKVWQHLVCMELDEETLPEHYYCEQCEPGAHLDLLRKLKQRRPRRRSSATRTIQKLSPSPSPPMTTAKAPHRRRMTTVSRAIAAEEEDLEAVLQLSMADVQAPDGDPRPVMIVGPKKGRKRSMANSVPPEETTQSPPLKQSRSASLTSEHPPPIEEATPNPEPLDVPEQTAPEHSDEETTHLPPPPPTTRGKRGGGHRKNTRKNATPSIIDDNDDAPTRISNRGRQPNQYSRRGGHSGAKRGGGHHGANESNKRFNNANTKSTRPTSPAPFLTSWGLPDHLSHLSTLLPSELPEPLDVRVSTRPSNINTVVTAGTSTGMAQERGVKVKWPTKRMTMGDMNKRVRNMLEYVNREQLNHAERKARMEALAEAIASGRYKPATPEPDESMAMEVDGLVTGMDEDVKPVVNGDSAVVTATPVAEGRQMRPRNVNEVENETVKWMKSRTDDMLNDLVTDLIAFQDRYRAKSRRHLTVGAAA